MISRPYPLRIEASFYAECTCVLSLTTAYEKLLSAMNAQKEYQLSHFQFFDAFGF